MRNRFAMRSRAEKRLAFVTAEVLVVVALTGIVISLVATLLGQMLRCEADARRAADESRELARLAIRFRGDAHAARELTIDEGAGRLAFTHSDTRAIDYIAHNGRVERIVRDGGNATARDSFKLSDEESLLVARTSFERTSPDEADSLAALVVQWKDETTRRPLAPQRVSRIEARLERDRNLLARATGENP